MDMKFVGGLFVASALVGCSGGGENTPNTGTEDNSTVLPSTNPDDDPSPNSPTDVNNEQHRLNQLSDELRLAILATSEGRGLDAYLLPRSDDFSRIPQDPSNNITAEKVALGQMLFHDTAFSLNGVSGEENSGTWSCATCHNSTAGFKPGIPQGIAEGGEHYGPDGSLRTLQSHFDPFAESDATNLPDIQPIAVPSILNSGYQNVKLWDGELGNPITGSVNSAVGDEQLFTEGTGRVDNSRYLEGLETQAVFGIGFHRMRMELDDIANTQGFQELWSAAYGSGSVDVREDAAKAIAAFERTVLASKAPFQNWLRDQGNQLTETELRGGILFFSKAGCTDCHQGPGLSSDRYATESELFFNIGLNDFDNSDPRIHGSNEGKKLGRGGFTLDPAFNYHFKIPQLYNLKDAPFYGHGSSFNSLRDIISYKNTAVAQNTLAAGNVSPDFKPLGLTDEEIDQLTAFVSEALHDPDLARYEPRDVPSGSCVTVDPLTIETDWRCEHSTD